MRVSTALDRDLVVIALTDSGEGIAEDQIDLIFDPLFSTKHSRGTGLGLTIVKQIISEHNGEVEVESEPGKQTTFRIRLPRHLAGTGVAGNGARPSETIGAANVDDIQERALALKDSALVDE